jgi:hypothetical protein
MAADDDAKQQPTRSSNTRTMIKLRAAGLALGILGVSGLRLLWKRFGQALLVMLKENQFLQVVFSGTAMGLVTRAGMLVRQKVSERLWSTVQVKSTETELWNALLKHLTAGETPLLESQTLTAKKQKNKKRQTWQQSYLAYQLGKVEMEVEYTPGENCSGLVDFEDTRIFLSRRSDGQAVTVGWNRSLVQPEVMFLRTWGQDSSVLKRFLAAAVRTVKEETAPEINIMCIGDGWPGGWQKAVTKPVRSLDSVVLHGNLQERMLADARQFQRRAAWYEGAGIPYRRGYLLHGPPGCGKTSFCQALAGALGLDVCMLSLSNKSMDDNQLAAHLRDAPANAIVLLEDVDAVFVGRELATSGKAESPGVTFSGLLNAIDGAAAQEGRMLFMTTNHKEKLDPALIRPGRCDVQVEIDNASRDQMRRIFVRFFAGQAEHAKTFASRLPEGEISLAKLQGFLLEHKGDDDQDAADGAAKAVNAVPDLLLEAKPVALCAMSTFAHLRRVGLERFAPLFEHHGFLNKAQIDEAGLKAADCAHWDFDLASDPHAMRRLALLLEDKEKQLLESYALAELVTAREAFIGAYFSAFSSVSGSGSGGGGGGGGGGRAPSSAEPHGADASSVGKAASPPPPSLKRQHSGLSRTAPACEVYEKSEGERLAEAFVHALTSTRDSEEEKLLAGKSVVSTWQLRWLLAQNPDDPRGALAAAEAVAAPRAAADALRRPEPMTAHAFLRRLGLEQSADGVEGKGHRTARQLAAVPKDDLPKCGITDDEAVARILAVAGCKAADASLTRDFQCPDGAAVRRIFAFHFPDGGADLARSFTEQVTDGTGFGLASHHMVDAHLTACAAEGGGGAQAAVDTATSKLIEVVREKPQEPEPAVDPTDFVFVWLKEEGLERWAGGFIGAELCTREDLTRGAMWEESQLEAVGVDKMGSRRRILQMLSKLREDDGTEA